MRGEVREKDIERKEGEVSTEQVLLDATNKIFGDKIRGSGSRDSEYLHPHTNRTSHKSVYMNWSYI
jgi:hypothetical protein